MTQWMRFLQVERERYATYDNNRFAIGGANVSRYYDYLVVILGRYEAASKALNANFEAFNASISESLKDAKSGKLNPIEMHLLAEGDRLSTLAHLEIEAFYLFAKIFLDRLASFLEMYFGQAHRLSLVSYDKLAKNLNAYAASKGLELPEGLNDTLIYLRNHLVEFRDKQITHQHNLRILRGTGTAAEGATMSISHLYPKDTDAAAQSTRLHELFAVLNRYVDQIIQLITTNRSRSRFTPVSPPIDAKSG